MTSRFYAYISYRFKHGSPWLRARAFPLLIVTLLGILVLQYLLLLVTTPRVSDTGSGYSWGLGNVRRLFSGSDKKGLFGKRSSNLLPFNLSLPAAKAELEMLFRLAGNKGTSTPPGLCPYPPPNLKTKVPVTYEYLSWKELERRHDDIEAGGLGRPGNCTAREHVAIIVPYRDRNDHLRTFLNHIHPFLKKQLIYYRIYIVEQDPYSPFNRGMLLNIGFVEAMADHNYACAIFHDVDLLPENEYNLYTCPEQPRHMSAAIDEFAYRLPYAELFGGIEAFSKEHFLKINGFSNQYFGWGAEDDDLYQRISRRGLNITRYPMDIARYSMIRHIKNQPNPSRFDMLEANVARFHKDGLNSLKYDRKRFERRKLFTWIYVRLNQTLVVNTKSPVTTVQVNL